MDIHHISVQRTARIYTQGKIGKTTRYIWLCTHGYGMLGQYFIRKFEPLPEDVHHIIVPEALSRFYSDGLTGKIGASWMTAEDREYEIKDYVAYLDEVYQQMILPYRSNGVKFIALGFSQGATAMLRWANQTAYCPDEMVCWGGAVPPDVLADCRLNTSKLHLMIGDNDPFIPMAEFETKYADAKNILKGTRLHIYKGGHQIIQDELMTAFVDKVLKNN